jgi:nitrogen fixation protein NifU and related proteins
MEKPLYKEELLDHYRHPRNQGKLSSAHASFVVFNPSCGDEISMQICVEQNGISQIAFQGKGCVISQAAGSLLTEKVLGKALGEVEALTKKDMLDLVGCPLGPSRLRCALLPLDSLHEAVALYKQLHC